PFLPARSRATPAWAGGAAGTTPPASPVSHSPRRRSTDSPARACPARARSAGPYLCPSGPRLCPAGRAGRFAGSGWAVGRGLGGPFERFVRGVGTGLVGLVAGPVQMLLNPVETITSLAKLLGDDEVQYRFALALEKELSEAFDKGDAEALGRLSVQGPAFLL